MEVVVEAAIFAQFGVKRVTGFTSGDASAPSNRSVTETQWRKSHEAPKVRREAAEGIPRSSTGATWDNGGANCAFTALARLSTRTVSPLRCSCVLSSQYATVIWLRTCVGVSNSLTNASA